jgi:hypothetical protein
MHVSSYYFNLRVSVNKIAKKELSTQSIIYGILQSGKDNIHVSVTNKFNIHLVHHKS